MSKLILNCLPPVMLKSPSLALSILKNFMQSNSVETKIHYWNISLTKFYFDFFKNNEQIISDEFYRLFPFFCCIALKNNDKELYQKIIYKYKSLFPHLINNEFFSYDLFLQEQVDILEDNIINQLKDLGIHDCKLLGVQAKLYQLIPANVITKITKTINPQVRTVIGGIGSSAEAVAIMNNFPFYDFAVWGEGEQALLDIYTHVDNNSVQLDEICGLVYRENDKLKISSPKRRLYINLNDASVMPDFSDFFSQNLQDQTQLLIPIEGSRGCHWRRCKFCFLNDGYKYRTKNIQNIITEINTQIERFHINNFFFLDNDLVGKDIDTFDLLLDNLISLRNTHEDFAIDLSEIISKGLDATIIKKMTLAGFTRVQIGLEALSDTLLTKISKKNSLASNLLFLKWAQYYSLQVDGLNILRGLLEETEEDILESIDNLHFFRFFEEYLDFNIGSLAVSYTSKYHKELENNELLNEWTFNQHMEFLPVDYVKFQDVFKIFFFSKPERNPLWFTFENINRYYKSSNYQYVLIRNNEIVYFKELYNNLKIKEFVFDKPVYWDILKLCNCKVLSIDNIIQNIKEKYQTIDTAELIGIISELKRTHLLYTNTDYSEIVTIINTDRINSD